VAETIFDPIIPEADRGPEFASSSGTTAGRDAGARLDSGALLDRVAEFIRRFVVLRNEHQAVALALWIAHTHAFEAADSTPYPLITSPEKRSGKSLLLEVLELLVARGWYVSGVSEAVVFRKINKDRPTLLLDEVDAIFGVREERTEPLRALINSGSRRNGKVARCVGPNHDVEDFSVFCPKCLAGIETGRLPETIRDRSIPIRVQRKLDEVVERFRFRTVSTEAADLREELSRWGEENVAILYELFPPLPDDLNDRAAEGWEPLLAIADNAGGEWPTKGRKAAVALCADVEVEDDSFGVQLLTDLKRIWDPDEVGYTLSSAAICDALTSSDDGPWRTWGRNRKVPGFSPRDLAQHLRRYGIRPKTVRLGGDATAKGYQHGQFTDAWSRYLPQSVVDDGEE
jgi:hypothetical protein